MAGNYRLRPLDCLCRPNGGTLDRRQTLRATGVGFVAALTAMLAGAKRTALAQAVAAHAPVVDKLTVRIVTDNLSDRYMIPHATPGMLVERIGATEKKGVEPHATLEAEWGLAMVAESTAGHEIRRVMIDFGYSLEVLLNNLGLLEIDPATLDALVLSHGHHDHYGGLLGLLQASKGRLKPNLPLFVGGEDCFCARHGANDVDYGVLDRPAILATGIRLMVAEGPAVAADHAITSGQIPKRTREEPLRGTTERTGLVAGLGCDPAKEPAAKNTGAFIPDDFQHEITTSYVVRGKGLVVLTSCSHRGIMNCVLQARAAAGVDKLHAVIGGFHLVPPLSDDYVRQTVADLKALAPDYVVPAHCAGERFYDIARAEMPGRVVRSTVGTRFTFQT